MPPRFARSTRKARAVGERPRVIALLVALALAALLAPPISAPSAADSYAYGYPNSGFVPDAYPHSWCWGATPPDVYWRGAMEDAVWYLDVWTDAEAPHDDAACGEGVDMITEIRELGGTMRGEYSCEILSAGICYEADIGIDNDLPDYQQRRKTMCHEIGHSVGLTHGITANNHTYTDCMRSGAVPSGTQWRVYSQQHLDHISCLCDYH